MNDDFEKIESIFMLSSIFDIDIQEDEEDRKALLELEKACTKNKIGIGEDDKGKFILAELKEPAKMSDGSENNVVKFYTLKGKDRKRIQNAKEDKRGDVLQLVIGMKTGISRMGMDNLDSKDCGLLESIFTFLL